VGGAGGGCVCVDKYVFMNPKSVGSVFYFQNMNLRIHIPYLK
jgi:hypothetical protein